MRVKKKRWLQLRLPICATADIQILIITTNRFTLKKLILIALLRVFQPNAATKKNQLKWVYLRFCAGRKKNSTYDISSRCALSINRFNPIIVRKTPLKCSTFNFWYIFFVVCAAISPLGYLHLECCKRHIFLMCSIRLLLWFKWKLKPYHNEKDMRRKTICRQINYFLIAHSLKMLYVGWFYKT